MAEEYGVHRNTFSRYLSIEGLCKKKVRFNHNYFSLINDQDKAYWLGFLMADGCVSTTYATKLLVLLNGKDIGHLVKFHKSLESFNRIRDRGDGTVVSAHYSKNICNDLTDHGCTPRKSLTLKFPWHIGPEFYRHVVRGYFDGDGCISTRSNAHQIRLNFVGTEDFLQSIQHLTGTNRKLHNTGRARTLEISGNKQVCRICEWLYSGANIFLDRKKEKYDSFIHV